MIGFLPPRAEIDGKQVDCEAVLDALDCSQLGRSLIAISNTERHPGHTGGFEALVKIRDTVLRNFIAAGFGRERGTACSLS